MLDVLYFFVSQTSNCSLFKIFPCCVTHEQHTKCFFFICRTGLQHYLDIIATVSSLTFSPWQYPGQPTLYALKCFYMRLYMLPFAFCLCFRTLFCVFMRFHMLSYINIRFHMLLNAFIRFHMLLNAFICFYMLSNAFIHILMLSYAFMCFRTLS